MLLNQSLKEFAFSEVISYALWKLVNLENGQRVSTMKRVWDEVRNEHKTSVCTCLFSCKFNLMQCLLKQLLVDAFALHVLQCLEDHFFAVCKVVHRDALNTDGKGGLTCSGVITSTRTKIRSNSFLYDCFVKRCIRAAKQDRRENVKAERFVVVLGGK